MERPPTRKKVRSRVVDNEIADEEHDALLTWLAGNLEEVVHEFWDFNSEDRKRAVASAVKQFRSSIAEASKQLRARAKTYQTKLPTLASALKKQVALLESIAVPPIDAAAADEFGKAQLRGWTAQSPVHERLPEGSEREPKVVGFVDVVAEVTLLKEFDLSSLDLPIVFTWPYASESDLERVLQDWKVQAPTWGGRKVKEQIWFDVRASGFAVGALLRDLKTLREFNPNGIIAVVTQDCPPEHREILVHEGFWLVDRALWD